MNNTTSIYGLFDPRESEMIFYVGKGLAKRAQSHWNNFVKRRTAVSGRLRRRFASLQSYGVEAQWRFIEENVTEWEEREKFWIAYWREKNSNLCNVREGGNACPIDLCSIGGRIGGRIGGSKGGRRTHELYPNLASESGRIGGLKGGRIGGRKNVESGHWARCQRLGCLVGGRRTHELYPNLASENGRIASHRRCHLKRNRVNVWKCDLCLQAALMSAAIAGVITEDLKQLGDVVGWIDQFS